MKIDIIPNFEANFVTSSQLKIWHERLGHVSLKSLREMNKQGIINVSQILQDFVLFCEACQFDKQHRFPFYDASPRNNKPGELIHSDIGGPIQEESIGGSRFYAIFKDDSTGFTYVYFMKHKSDVFEKFKEFNALVANQLERSIKILRCDNGTEYIIVI